MKTLNHYYTPLVQVMLHLFASHDKTVVFDVRQRDYLPLFGCLQYMNWFSNSVAHDLSWSAYTLASSLAHLTALHVHYHDYQRLRESSMTLQFDFGGTPVRLHLKKKDYQQAWQLVNSQLLDYTVKRHGRRQVTYLFKK